MHHLNFMHFFAPQCCNPNISNLFFWISIIIPRRITWFKKFYLISRYSRILYFINTFIKNKKTIYQVRSKFIHFYYSIHFRLFEKSYGNKFYNHASYPYKYSIYVDKKKRIKSKKTLYHLLNKI